LNNLSNNLKVGRRYSIGYKLKRIKKAIKIIKKKLKSEKKIAI